MYNPYIVKQFEDGKQKSWQLSFCAAFSAYAAGLNKVSLKRSLHLVRVMYDNSEKNKAPQNIDRSCVKLN
jgi:hypothetical protein